MEGPIQSFILLVSIATFDAYLLIPGALSLAVFIYFYLEGRKAIVAIKEFDLKLKSPVFQMIGEMTNGLIQIKNFGKRFTFLSEFAQKLNNSSRVNICNWNLSRGYVVNLNYINILLMLIGWFVGIMMATPETAALYGMSVIFLLKINDLSHYSFKQIIYIESLMVSV